MKSPLKKRRKAGIMLTFHFVRSNGSVWPIRSSTSIGERLGFQVALELLLHGLRMAPEADVGPGARLRSQEEMKGPELTSFLTLTNHPPVYERKYRLQGQLILFGILCFLLYPKPPVWHNQILPDGSPLAAFTPLPAPGLRPGAGN